MDVDHNEDLLSLATTIDVVVLRETDGQTAAVMGAMPIDLTNGQEPTGRLLSELLDSSVRLTDAEGLPSAVLQALADIPVPHAFRSSPWLASSRGLVLRGKDTLIGGHAVDFSNETGLAIDYADEDE
jgi:hypothetical protein